MTVQTSDKKWRWLVAAFLLSGVCGWIGGYVAHPPAARGAGVPPFTVVQINQMFGTSKKDPMFVGESTFARRSDGSWLHAYTAVGEDGIRRKVVEYVDLKSLVAMHSEPVTQSITTRPLSVSEIVIEAAAGFKTCDGSESGKELASATMLGYSVVRVITKDSGGTEVKWVAPQLDCYPLQSEYTALEGRRVVDVVTNVRAGEPEATLFQVPEGYVERSPREIHDLYGAKIHGGRYLSDHLLEKADKRYQAARKRVQ